MSVALEAEELARQGKLISAQELASLLSPSASGGSPEKETAPMQYAFNFLI